MHIILITVLGIIAIACFSKANSIDKANGVAPLSRNQMRRMRKATRTGVSYSPQRRPWGTAPPRIGERGPRPKYHPPVGAAPTVSPVMRTQVHARPRQMSDARAFFTTAKNVILTIVVLFLLMVVVSALFAPRH